MNEKEYFEEKKLANDLQFDLNMFASVPCNEACKICNGIGPAAFPQIFINALNKLHPSLKPVADNHDMGFHFGSGTQKDFKEVNDAFYSNGCKVAKWRYKAYDPRRYIVIFDAWKFSRACQNKFGWAAYTAAIRQRKEGQQVNV